jgi:hypothetical protein
LTTWQEQPLGSEDVQRIRRLAEHS